MNKQLIEKVADAIEGETLKARPNFDMRNATHSCGSPACIAGWTVAAHREIEPNEVRDVDLYDCGEHGLPDILSEASRLIGLSREEETDLFTPGYAYACWHAHPGDEGGISAEHAVRVLRRLARTGKVDWKLADWKPEKETA